MKVHSHKLIVVQHLEVEIFGHFAENQRISHPLSKPDTTGILLVSYVLRFSLGQQNAGRLISAGAWVAPDSNGN